MNAVLDFIRGVAPWVPLGLLLTIFAVRSAAKDKKGKKPDSTIEQTDETETSGIPTTEETPTEGDSTEDTTVENTARRNYWATMGLCVLECRSSLLVCSDSTVSRQHAAHRSFQRDNRYFVYHHYSIHRGFAFGQSPLCAEHVNLLEENI